MARRADGASSRAKAFAPGLARDYLGTTDALMIAVVFASIVVMTPLGGTSPED
jgi:hypothetical protein